MQVRAWLNRSAWNSQQRQVLRGQHAVPAARCRITAAAAKQDALYRTLSEVGEVAVLVMDGTRLVSEAVTRHQTAPTASAALGRALLGALLIGSFRKEDEATQISFKGDGPIGNIIVVADTKGNVKGLVGNPAADPPLREDGKLNVGAAVGEGLLAVVRSHPLEPTPYTGVVPIVSGEVAEDIANYLVESEQTNSALGLGVSINRDCSVKAAGGFLVQVLPFCSEETLSQLESNLANLDSITQMLNDGLQPEDIARRILNGLGEAPGALTLQPRYGPCERESLKERMMRAVASLGAQEIREIMEEQGRIDVKCEFCNETFQLEEQALLEMVAPRNE